jgi:hypothetical protein
MLLTSPAVKARKFCRWYRDQVLKLFETVDAISCGVELRAAPKTSLHHSRSEGRLFYSFRPLPSFHTAKDPKLCWTMTREMRRSVPPTHAGSCSKSSM